jgi:cysteine desulfurase/selenocysteine lyase
MSTLTKEAIAGLDVEALREDFPLLKQTVHGKPLVYLDSAATAQKPSVVVEAIRRFHEVDCANIHPGVHELSQRSTAAYEETRTKVRRFLHATRRLWRYMWRCTCFGSHPLHLAAAPVSICSVLADS